MSNSQFRHSALSCLFQWLTLLGLTAFSPKIAFSQTDQTEEAEVQSPPAPESDSPPEMDSGTDDATIASEAEVQSPPTPESDSPPETDSGTDDATIASEATDTSPPAAPRSAPVLRLATEDGESSLRFRLVAQIRWTYDHADQGPNQQAESDNDIRFRRLRLIMDGSIFTRDFTYSLHVNLVPGFLELMDFFLDYRFHPQIAVRLGQWKIPFTRYRLGSFTSRPCLDWSYPTTYFGAERQMGVLFHNNVSNPPRFEYQVGVYTGVNARASNGIGMALVSGEPRPNPSNIVDPAAPDSFHPEIAAHFAYNHGGIDVRAPQDFAGGGPRFSLGLSASWDLRPTEGQDETLRLAPEAILKVHGVTLWCVFYAVFFEEMADDEELRLGFLGGVAQASYVFLERYEVGLRYTNVSILSALRTDTRRRADEKIGEAPDDTTREELESQYATVGLLQAEHELILGFNTYWLAQTLKLGVDGAMLVHQRTDGDRYDMRIRIQAQLAF